MIKTPNTQIPFSHVNNQKISTAVFSKFADNFSISLTALLAAVVLSSGCASNEKKLKSEIDSLKSEVQKSHALNQNLSSEKLQLEEKLIATTKDKGQLKANLEEMKKAIEEMKARQAEQKKRLQEFSDLTARFKSLTDSGALSVQIIDGKMVVSLGSDVLFSSGSAKLSQAGLESIKQVTAQLVSIPGKRYQIEGHTDNAKISTAVFPSNWELASARALNVTRAMIDAGLQPERISAASYAETSPVQSNETPEGKAANRRIAIVIVPDLTSLPGYEELNKLGVQ